MKYSKQNVLEHYPFHSFKLQKKIFDTIRSKEGKVINSGELFDKFFEESNDIKKRHKSKHPKKNSSSLKKEYIDQILFFLRNVGLVEINKKIITVKSPFSLKGRISFNSYGEGFVSLPGRLEVFIPNHKKSTAIQGDMVEVVPYAIGRKERLEGEVVQVTQRGRDLYRLIVQEIHPNYFIGLVSDLRGEPVEGILYKKSLLQEFSEMIKKDDVLIVRLDEEGSNSSNLYEVKFVRFEKDDKEDPDFTRICIKYGFSPVYPPIKMPKLEENVDESTIHDWNHRVDLRELYTVTIDGATAKDFDDAISLIKSSDNLYKFYVHIADVSHYVVKGSELDEEAYHRATSVYLGNRVVPMLPPELSENLCSLVSGKNRLAFTVEMEADGSGNILYAKFYKSIIEVDKRLTYEGVEKELGTDPWLTDFNKLAEILRSKRMKEGRIDLNLNETELVYDENKNIKDIIKKNRLKSHMLIEELMLSANIKVAEYIFKKKYPTLNRIHEPMDEDKLENLNHFLKLNQILIQIKDVDYAAIQKVIENIKDDRVSKMFNYLLLRSFMQAYYGPESEGHWGLGFSHYCHFTSPIRRYPDLVVHRVLQSIIESSNPPYNHDEVFQMGFHSSQEERRAQDSERDLYKIKACRYILAKGIHKTFGNITGFRPAFVFIELEGLPIEGIVDKSELTNDFELLIRGEFSFYSKKFSKEFFLGQRVEVEIKKVDLEEMRIYLAIVGW